MFVSTCLAQIDIVPPFLLDSARLGWTICHSAARWHPWLPWLPRIIISRCRPGRPVTAEPLVGCRRIRRARHLGVDAPLAVLVGPTFGDAALDRVDLASDAPVYCLMGHVGDGSCCDGLQRTITPRPGPYQVGMSLSFEVDAGQSCVLIAAGGSRSARLASEDLGRQRSQRTRAPIHPASPVGSAHARRGWARRCAGRGSARARARASSHSSRA